MKTVALFLSLFFAMLVALPCNDSVSPSSNSSVSVQEKNDVSHHSDSDACSAFCTCACCGIMMTLEKTGIEVIENKIIHHTAKIPDYQQFSLLKIPSGIWQPPKLG